MAAACKRVVGIDAQKGRFVRGVKLESRGAANQLMFVAPRGKKTERGSHQPRKLTACAAKPAAVPAPALNC